MIHLHQKVVRLFLGGLVVFGLLLYLGCQPSTPTREKKETDKAKIAMSSEALEHLTQGQKFLQDRKLDEALKEFQETARLAPDSPLAHFWLGRVYFDRQDKDQAEKAFKKVLELEPDNYHAMAWLGKIYSFDRDKLDVAHSSLIKALEKSPENLDAHFDLARVYGMMGERQKALREFAFIFARERDFFFYHFELGRMLEAWGEPEKAMEEYKRAHVLNPHFKPVEDAIKRLEARKTEGKTPSSPPPAAPPSPAAPTTPVRR
ncbi:MAG: tetratricopeptide repeat protein [Desulfobacca sp.]|uniref:tetratricopeptide repeat protein n=1 Tax=Desulfobacca sp. TaxID=2067990 RepID=UPI00404A1E72